MEKENNVNNKNGNQAKNNKFNNNNRNKLNNSPGNNGNKPNNSPGNNGNKPNKPSGNNINKPNNSVGNNGNRPNNSSDNNGNKPNNSPGNNENRPNNSPGNNINKPNNSVGNNGNKPNNSSSNSRNKPNDNNASRNNKQSSNNVNINSNKQGIIIDTNKEQEKNKPNKSSNSNSQDKKDKLYQIDGKHVVNMTERHVNNESGITEYNVPIAALCKAICPKSLDTLVNISTFLEVMQMIDIKNFKSEDAFKVYSHLFDKIYEVKITADATTRNELVRRVVNSIREFTKKKSISQNILEEELIKEKHDEELRGKIVRAITIKNKKQGGIILEYIKYIDMWCQGISLSINEITQILDFLQWIPEELCAKAHIEINSTEELKRELKEVFDSNEYQGVLMKHNKSKEKVKKITSKEINKDDLQSNKEQEQNNYEVLKQKEAEEKFVNIDKLVTKPITQGGESITHKNNKAIGEEKAVQIKNVVSIGGKKEAEVQKIIKEDKIKDEKLIEKTRLESDLYDGCRGANTMSEVLEASLIKQLNLKIANLKKQNDELINRNINIEKDRNSVNVELGQLQEYIVQLEVDKNKLHREVSELDEFNVEVQMKKESLQQANETLTTMLEKGKTFELDAYKSKIKSKLQFEYQQYIDTQEIIQAGIDENIAEDVIELLYEVTKNIWKVLEENGVSYGDK